MKKGNTHTPHHDPSDLRKEALDRMEVNFPSTKEEAWNRLSGLMDQKAPATAQAVHPPVYRRLLPLAAAIVLLLAIGTTMRLYTKTVPAGMAEQVILPDGSGVQVTEGEIAYQPLWWKIRRSVQLEGSARFDVAKGKTFSVKSEAGITEVLGTSFSVSTFNDTYSVACFTGSVRVTSRISDVSAVLTPNEIAVVDASGTFEITLMEENQPEPAAKPAYLTFKGRTVEEVFSTLADHYGVVIEVRNGKELTFSGNFSADSDPETVIRSVCLPLNLTYEKRSDGSYIIQAPAEEVD